MTAPQSEPWHPVFSFRPIQPDVSEDRLREVIASAVDGRAFDLSLQENGYWRVKLNPTQWRGPGMSIQSNLDSRNYGRPEIEQALKAAGIYFDS